MKKLMVFGIAVMLSVVAFAGGCSRGAKVDIADGKVHVETDEGVVDINGQDGNVSVKTNEGSFNAKVSNDGDKVEYTAESAEGKMKMTTDVDPKQFGELAYPGAETVTGYDMQGADGKTAKSLTISTRDAIDKVVAYYKGKLVGGDVVDMASSSGMVMLTKPEGDMVHSVVITTDKESGGATIVVTISSK